MAFKLDPVSALGAIQKAKGWQQQSFGGASPMSFSSGLVGNKGSQIGPWDIMDEQPKIITPETGVFTNNATDTILGGQIDAYGNAAELGAQALGSLGAVHRSNKQYEFAKELAKQRKRDAEKKSGGGVWSSVGKIAGGFLGGAVAGPAGATIGSQAGGFLGGLFG